jgi:hypothetical protein
MPVVGDVEQLIGGDEERLIVGNDVGVCDREMLIVRDGDCMRVSEH